MQLDDQPVLPAGAPPLGVQFSSWLQAARNSTLRLLRVGAIVQRIVRRRGAVCDSQEQAWTGILERVIAELDLLNHATEQDFLKIRGRLIEFSEAVKVISSELTALANLISGDQGLRASEALAHALEHSMEMKERYAENNGGLGGFRQEAGQLKQILSGFQGTVATFQTFGVLTRIETARLGRAGEDFGNLADDVKKLTGNVQARVENALETAATLIPPIESAMQNIVALKLGQSTELPSVISEVLASLSSFREIQNRVHDSSIRLGAQFQAISGAFTKLVVSIQFHDITRQQVEHVIEVLRRLCSASAGEIGSISRDPRGATAILALQSSQLADAGGKFAVSVASIASNLDDIAEHVMKMADESRTLSGLSEDENNSFFQQMEQGCTVIPDALSHCADAEAETRVTTGGLSDTIGRIRASIEEIRAIEIQIQRMAMNASIRATHIGASGNALGVLADSMQAHALDFRQRSDFLAETLGSMSEAAIRLSGQRWPAAATERGGQHGYMQEMRTAVLDLHASSESSLAQIAQIIACGARLREDLSTTRKSFAVGALFAEGISRARSMLKGIERESDSGLLQDSAEPMQPMQQGLADFASHYTMQAERDLHEAITKGTFEAAPTAVQTEQSEFTSEPEGEPDDNVEFF